MTARLYERNCGKVSGSRFGTATCMLNLTKWVRVNCCCGEANGLLCLTKE